MTNTNYEETFASFLRRRQAINQKLDSSRSELDAFFQRHPLPLSVQALATLEIALRERRELLAALVDIDDQLMNELVLYRSKFNEDQT